MPTAILSDLHLGAAHGDDLLRYPFFCDLLREQLDGIDHIVLLGDILDLRFQQLEEVLLTAAPFLAMLGDVLSNAEHPRLTYIPGNHDHHYAVRLMEAEQERAIEAGEPYTFRHVIAPPNFFLSRQLARLIGIDEVAIRLAYFFDTLDSSEGQLLLTHGHYLDLHLGDAPARLLSLVQATIASAGQNVEALSPDLYEAILRPQYELLHWIGQSPGGGQIQSRIYARLRGGAPPSTRFSQIRQAALRRAASFGGRVGVALAETLANRLIKGGLSLTSPAREAQAEETIYAFNLSLEALEPYLPPDIRYVIFGHTHRPGPLADVDLPDRWKVTLRGQETIVMNSGSWLYDAGKARRPDYCPQRWPGTFILVPDQGPPRLVETLADLSREALEAQLYAQEPEEIEPQNEIAPDESEGQTDTLLQGY